MQNRTGSTLDNSKILPPRPACPPWCIPDACSLRHEDGDGWVGTHGDALVMVTAGDLWWTVQLQQFISPSEVTAPAISVDTNATGLDWVAADTAEELAAALLNAAVRLRAASRLSAVRAA